MTRVTSDADARGKAPREWRIKEATLIAEYDAPHAASGDQHSSNAQSESPFALLTVHIRWRGESKNDVDPTWRFDATFAIGRGYQQ